RTTLDGATVARDGGSDAPSCADDCASKGQRCSLGRCTSYDCYQTELSAQNIAGCLFYTLQADNVAADEGAETTFLVTNLDVDPTNVQLDVAQATSGGTTWVAMGGRQ